MQKGRRRRKHHMPWTLSEVMKLIEGVSHLGVGRWSKIKRLLFSSSKHRTSVDLKVHVTVVVVITKARLTLILSRMELIST